MNASESNPPIVPAHAGVFFPPPFVYVAGIAAAWGLNRWHPLPISSGNPTLRLLLVAVFAAGYLVIFGTALAAFRRSRTTIIPNKPASTIVTAGPYGWTRNPMYVSLVSLYLAAAILLNTWWALLLLPVVVLIIDRNVIAREERYLSAAFPAEYGQYRQRVRRWV